MTAVESDRVAAGLAQDFRTAMGSVVAAVSVVTTFRDGRPLGSTVSAFGSLSMEPPMMFVSLDNRSSLLSQLWIGARAAVNVLASPHDVLAAQFAQRGLDRFAGVRWMDVHGAPALADRLALISLRVAELVPAGDHTMMFGDVLDAKTNHGPPLSYWRRTFGTHRPH